MSNKHMERWLPSSLKGEIQIKTTIRCHTTIIKMTKILKRKKRKKLRMPSVLEDVGWLEHSDTPGGSGKWYNRFGKQLGQFL